MYWKHIVQQRITDTSGKGPWPKASSSSLTCCVTLGKYLALPELQPLHLHSVWGWTTQGFLALPTSGHFLCPQEDVA